MATHNERLAASCDRILLLRDGVLTPVTSGLVPRQEINAP
jgi:ABC-type lipoprotein export system ATPase subunit